MARARPTQQSDRDLIALILADGDETAFRELYRRHTPRLHQLLLRMLGGVQQDAEDVVQETWVRAIEGAAKFEWKSSFPSWLSGIGINRAKELLRRRNRRPMFDLTEQLEPRAPVVPMGERIDLERALELLPDGYRTVLVLHDVEGYRHEEIAERLGIAAGTSKSQLFHARRYVRALLEPVKEIGNEQVV
jgi:RNA polymerase sigma-70 factor (ECF subfamily)